MNNSNDQHISDGAFGLSASRDDAQSQEKSDFASAPPARGKSAVKMIFAPQNKLRLLAYGGVGVLLASALAYGFFSDTADDARTASVGNTAQGARVNTRENTQTTLAQRKANDEFNTQQLAVEQEKNPNAHPVLTMDDQEENPFQEQALVRPPGKVSDATSGNNVSQPARPASKPRQDTVADTELDKLITGLIEDEGRAPKAMTVAWSYSSPKTHPQGGGERSAASNDGQGARETTQTCDYLTRAGRMYMATSDLALNSDVDGPVSLTVRNGDVRNFQLIGTFKRQEEWVRMELTTLVTPAKTYTNIKAIGLDVATSLNAVSGDINRHLMYRYGWWGFGSVLKAVGSAAERNANQTVVVSDGAAVQSSEKDASREVKMMLGSLGTDLGSAFQDRLDRPITITLKVGDEVGVFFMEDVCR